MSNRLVPYPKRVRAQVGNYDLLASKNTAEGLIAFYNTMFAPMGITMPPHLIPVCYALMDQRIQKLIVVIGPGSGKEGAYSLEVPTPSGQRRWGDLMPGDYLFGRDGRPTQILQRHENGVKPIYKVSFDDRTSTLVGLEHNWRVRGRKQRKHGKNNWLTLTTAQIIEQGVIYPDGGKYARKNFEIPMHEACQYPFRMVPVDPYVVGVWLGDGSRNTSNYTKYDREIAEVIRSRGYEVFEKLHTPKSTEWRVRNLRTGLLGLGIGKCRSWEKYVPILYKENSPQVRLDVLRGLMDTDGYCSDRGTAIFTSTSKQLAEDVAWLVRSLGGKAIVSPNQKYFTHKGKKKAGRPSYDVNLVMPDGINPFYLPRKRDLVRATTQARYLTRWISSIEYSHDEQAMCVSVDAADHLYLCNDFIVTHNSLLLSVCYPAHRLGIDPRSSILNISAGESLPQGFLTATMKLIEESREYRVIFPDTVPDYNSGWSSRKGLFVSGHGSGNPDASYLAVGIDSSALTGKHATTLILDDIHDKDNSQNAVVCDKVVRTYYNTVLGRADPRGCRFIVAGRRWHQNDIYGELSKGEEYVMMTLPAERLGTDRLYWDIVIPDELSVTGCVFTTGEMNV